MTLARRTFLAACIALATAFAVVVLISIDAGSQPGNFERVFRD